MAGVVAPMSDLGSVLVTGARGMLGSYVDFGTCLGREELDVTNVESVRAAFEKYAPRIVLNLAAATDLARCEADPAYAQELNVHAAELVAGAAQERGAKMVYLSTIGVFDGTKSSPYEVSDLPNPQNEYARSKYAGEQKVSALAENHLIIRTSWLFGGGPTKDHKFVGKLLPHMHEPKLSIVTGTMGSPSYAKDVVQGIRALLEEDAQGVRHVVNAGVATRRDIAEALISLTGSSSQIVDIPPGTFGSSPGEAVANESALSSVPLRPWEDALERYVHAEWPEMLR